MIEFNSHHPIIIFRYYFLPFYRQWNISSEKLGTMSNTIYLAEAEPRFKPRFVWLCSTTPPSSLACITRRPYLASTSCDIWPVSCNRDHLSPTPLLPQPPGKGPLPRQKDGFQPHGSVRAFLPSSGFQLERLAFATTDVLIRTMMIHWRSSTFRERM